MGITRTVDSDLIDALAVAIKVAAADLFRSHSTERFYYFALITTGEAHPPTVVAWSTEALDRAVARDEDPAKDRARRQLKWSYADSPYYGFGEHHFEKVRKLFALSPLDWRDEAEFAAGYEARMNAMVTAMARVDREGTFGSGVERDRIVINVECMPPDPTNAERARKLNPPEALVEWLKEAAESES